MLRRGSPALGATTGGLVRLAALCGACAASTAAAQGQLLQAPAFQTSATDFVDVPGATLSFDAGVNELVFLLWRATLSSTETGSPAAELLLTGRMGERWGQGAVSDLEPGRRVQWFNFDWNLGPWDIRARLRSRVDGGVARLEHFEAVALPLGAPGQFVWSEFNVGGPMTIGDAQWTSLVAASIPLGLPQPWLCLAQATIEEPNVLAGVSVRLRVGGQTFPEQITAEPASGFLTRGPGPRSFFIALHAGSPNLQAGDAVRLEALVNPRVLDGGSAGQTAVLRDLRLLLVPASVLGLVGTQQALGSAVSLAGPPSAIVSGPSSPLAPGDWELLALSTMAISDSGRVDHDLLVEAPLVPPSGLHSTPSRFGDDHPLLGALVLREVAGTQAPQWWLSTPAGSMTTNTRLISRWRYDGGVVAVRVDAGVVDAGVADAGALDAGEADAGSLDAGPPDAGLFDGGHQGDAGAGDAGPGDGGVPVPLAYQVGCGCAGGGASVLPLAPLLLSLLARGRRRSPLLRARRSPRTSCRSLPPRAAIRGASARPPGCSPPGWSRSHPGRRSP